MTWEGRLLFVVTAVLVVFGLAAVYGASSLVTTAGGQVGASFALRQAVGAVVGGLLAIIFARTDYHRWREWAWPLLGITGLLLVIPLLPFTHAITPTINGARRWVNLGILTLQPSELAVGHGRVLSQPQAAMEHAIRVMERTLAKEEGKQPHVA